MARPPAQPINLQGGQKDQEGRWSVPALSLNEQNIAAVGAFQSRSVITASSPLPIVEAENGVPVSYRRRSQRLVKRMAAAATVPVMGPVRRDEGKRKKESDPPERVKRKGPSPGHMEPQPSSSSSLLLSPLVLTLSVSQISSSTRNKVADGWFSIDVQKWEEIFNGVDSEAKILLPEGNFSFPPGYCAVFNNTPGLTISGMGPDKTTLTFRPSKDDDQKRRKSFLQRKDYAELATCECESIISLYSRTTVESLSVQCFSSEAFWWPSVTLIDGEPGADDCRVRNVHFFGCQLDIMSKKNVVEDCTFTGGVLPPNELSLSKALHLWPENGNNLVRNIVIRNIHTGIRKEDYCTYPAIPSERDKIRDVACQNVWVGVSLEDCRGEKVENLRFLWGNDPTEKEDNSQSQLSGVTSSPPTPRPSEIVQTKEHNQTKQRFFLREKPVAIEILEGEGNNVYGILCQGRRSSIYSYLVTNNTNTIINVKGAGGRNLEDEIKTRSLLTGPEGDVGEGVLPTREALDRPRKLEKGLAQKDEANQTRKGSPQPENMGQSYVGEEPTAPNSADANRNNTTESQPPSVNSTSVLKLLVSDIDDSSSSKSSRIDIDVQKWEQILSRCNPQSVIVLPEGYFAFPEGYSLIAESPGITISGTNSEKTVILGSTLDSFVSLQLCSTLNLKNLTMKFGTLRIFEDGCRLKNIIFKDGRLIIWSQRNLVEDCKFYGETWADHPEGRWLHDRKSYASITLSPGSESNTLRNIFFEKTPRGVYKAGRGQQANRAGATPAEPNLIQNLTCHNVWTGVTLRDCQRQVVKDITYRWDLANRLGVIQEGKEYDPFDFPAAIAIDKGEANRVDGVFCQGEQENFYGYSCRNDREVPGFRWNTIRNLKGVGGRCLEIGRNNTLLLGVRGIDDEEALRIHEEACRLRLQGLNDMVQSSS